jgi:5-methylcytosine-specific restriction endonuclease McrA
MKFELKPDNRNASDEDLIKDVINVAKSLSKDTITRNEYDEKGRYSEGTLRKRFGGWLNVLKKAGLSPTKDYYVTDEQLIDELKRIVNLPNVDVLSKDIFNKYKRISNTATITRRFGSWSKALKKAGLSISPSQSRYANEELFENLLNVWTYYGRQPTITEMSEQPSKITPNTYSNRFANWRKALEAFVEYANRGEQEAFNEEKNGEVDAEVKNLNSNRYKHKTSRNINLRLRFVVMKRDNFKCQKCGRSPATDPAIILHVDHIIPWEPNGETVLENLETLCSKCNLGKSNL